MKIALVSSIGGHLTELLALAEAWEGHELVWIVNDRSPVLPPDAHAYEIVHAERDWRALWNVVELAAILGRERPDLLVSAGASPAVPAGALARLAGVPIVYLEPSSAVAAPTATGRLMRLLTRRLYVQWPDLARKLPGARYAGRVF